MKVFLFFSATIILILSTPLRSFSKEITEIEFLRSYSEPPHINIFESLPPQEFDMKCLIGDYWSKSNGPHFDNCRLYGDGTFKISRGYSGGMFYVIDSYGNYYINEDNNTLKIKLKDFEQRTSLNSKPKIRKRDVGSDIEIVGFNDTIVVVRTTEFNLPVSIKVYRRSPGIMKNQTWTFALNDTLEVVSDVLHTDVKVWEHSITFLDHAQFTYIARNSGQGQDYGSTTYRGSYHLCNDMLYLTIRHKDGFEINVGRAVSEEAYTERCAYIRVDLENNRINLSDMIDIINDNLDEKDWRYSNCEFVTDHPIPDTLNDQWINFSVSIIAL